LLIFIIRPAAVLISTMRSELSFKERLFLSWLAPRGIVAAAVSSVFTLEILHMRELHLIPEALAQEARMLSPLVFLVIVITVSVYGLSARWVAGLLGISEPLPTGVMFVGADAFTMDMAKMLHSLEIPVLLVDSNYRKAAEARMKGLRVSNQLITREHVADLLDLKGLAHLLAMSSNDEVNSLALIHLAEVFDSSAQFQLVPEPRKSVGDQNVAAHLMGRLLFDKRATWGYLMDRHAAGAIIKKTPLTEDFTWQHYQVRYGESAIPLFVYSPNTRQIKICEADKPRPMEAGTELICLIDPPSEPESEK
jgi:hypothetical protein